MPDEHPATKIRWDDGSVSDPRIFFRAPVSGTGQMRWRQSREAASVFCGFSGCALHRAVPLIFSFATVQGRAKRLQQFGKSLMSHRWWGSISRHDRPLRCRCAGARNFVQDGALRGLRVYAVRRTPPLASARTIHPSMHQGRAQSHELSQSPPDQARSVPSGMPGRAEMCDIFVLRRPVTGTRRCSDACGIEPLHRGHRRNGCRGIA